MSLAADPDFKPIEYMLKVDPELNDGKLFYRVYDPVDLWKTGRVLHYYTGGIDRHKFPVKVQAALGDRKPLPSSSFRPPVIGDTEKLDRLLNWYAPLHNLSKDSALAKCVTSVSYELWLWKRPKFGCPPTAPLNEFRLQLLSIEVVKFPEGV